MPRFERAAWAFPLVGLAVGAIGAVVVLATAAVLPPMPAAALATAALVLVTGALHEDGLADVADGFGGGTTAERKLKIMRDSRIGAYGVIALIVALVLRIAAAGALIASSGVLAAACGLIAGEVVSRLGALWVWHALPPVRPDGLSASVGRPSRQSLIIGAFTALAAAGLLMPVLGGPVVAALLLAALAAEAMRRLARHHIGGQTGDVIGATQQAAAVAFLCGLLI